VRRGHRQLAAQGGEPVRDPLQTRAVAGRRRVEPTPVVADLEAELARAVQEQDRRSVRPRVLADVLQGLQAREVHGRLDVRGEPLHPVGLDRHGYHRPTSLRLERGRQSLVGEQRRIDPTREVPEILQRVRRGALERVEQCSRLRGIAFDHRSRQLQLDRERDELLLRAIVQVPFDLPALVVLRRDETPS
jgi:hypothetical protein